MASKALLIVAAVCLVQVCKGNDDVVNTLTLSGLKSHIESLSKNSNFQNCFNENLRKPYYHDVRGLAGEIKKYDERVGGLLEEYPGEMVKLIITKKDTSGAQKHMETMKQELKETDKKLQNNSGYKTVRDEIIPKIQKYEKAFLDCIEKK